MPAPVPRSRMAGDPACPEMPQNLPSVIAWSRVVCLVVAAAAGVASSWAQPAGGAPAAPVSPPAVAADAPATITTLGQYWAVPKEERDRLHPVAMDLTVLYYDPTWGALWVETG